MVRFLLPPTPAPFSASGNGFCPGGIRFLPSTLSASTRGALGVQFAGGDPGRPAGEVERKRKQIFDEGFAVFPQMWSEEEIQTTAAGGVLGKHQEKILGSFITYPSAVLYQHQLLHAHGFRCTDASTSPEPWWHHSWQVDGLECDDVHLCRTPPWIATLVVSLSDRNGRKNCGGVAVFPRSHWIVGDWIAASTLQRTPLPQPLDVPAASPLELELGRGDMALLHPWLAHTIAPNVSSTTAHLLIFHIGKSTSEHHKSSVELEMNQLQTEEAKAQLGGWQDTMTDMTSGLCSLALAPRTRVAPRDLLAWRLQTSVSQFMKDEQWSAALSMLQRLAGLRPNCYWTALQAGQCCMKSAPAGQLGGRAGRKCMLEDGERFLLRAIEIAPGWPLAYAELTNCLALMGRGRELEIPEVVEMMKRKCDVEQLCLRYPAASATLQSSWNTCESAMSFLCSPL